MNLPDKDHIMRYVPWSRLLRDERQNVIGFLPQAFALRRDERYLSVNWLEYLDGDPESRRRASVHAFRRTLQVGPKSAFGIGNVGRTKEVCLANGARARIVHRPEDEKNMAHSAIYDVPSDDLDLLQALAADVFVELIRNADVPEEARP